MKEERWAFSESELANPGECKSDDELVAYIDLDDDWEGVEGHGVVVYRNGKVSNRFADGTAGLPEGLAELANNIESLLHPDGEDTAAWKNVEVGDQGNFARFLDG
jgi:hypothetical protein